MRVVSDTSPLCYLVLIEEIRLLPELLETVTIPAVVRQELAHPEAPAEVRRWIADPPQWLSILDNPEDPGDMDLGRLEPGERAAILLAERLDAHLLLLDDRIARMLARDRGLSILGLIGLLQIAAERHLVDPAAVVERLRTTNFRASDALLTSIVSR